MCKFLEIVPIKSKEFLDIIWIIPKSFTLEYETKPESLIGHLFGHEGKNSLLSCLKKLGLATALTHYTLDEAQVFTIFSCQIELTNSDPINIDLVCEIVFGFLKILKESRDCKRLYDECAEIKRIHFEYKEKKRPIDYVTLMSDNMHKYKTEHVIVGDYLMNEYNEKSFLDLLEQFKFENMIISLKSKKFEGKTEFIEPIYNIKYNNRNLDEKIRFLFENPRDIYKKMMGLPFENQFLARNFQLITDENDKFPVKIFSKDNSSAYLKRGSVFQIPKLTIYLKIFINR